MGHWMSVKPSFLGEPTVQGGHEVKVELGRGLTKYMMRWILSYNP